MKTNTTFLRGIFSSTVFFVLCASLNAQVFNWNGTYGGSGANRTYTGAAVSGVTMTATINNTENVWQNSSPVYRTSSTPDGNCSPAAANYGLLLSTDWSNTSQNITVTINFSHLVGAVEFSLYDLNDDGSGSWLDRVQVSALNGAGAALNVTNLSACYLSGGAGNGGTYGTVSGSGTANLLYTSTNSSSACTCWGNTRLRVGNTGNCSQVASITIRYSTARSSGNPPSQYILISNLTAACVPLPIELSSFTGESTERGNLLKWETKTEKHNSHFNVERSTDGLNWETIANASGAGTTVHPKSYSVYDTDFEHVVNYYRLQQVDFDGTERESDIITIDNSLRMKTLDRIVNSMGQLVDENYKGLKIYIYTDGTIVKKMD